jgi:hypothetical protein
MKAGFTAREDRDINEDLYFSIDLAIIHTYHTHTVCEFSCTRWSIYSDQRDVNATPLPCESGTEYDLNNLDLAANNM